MAKAMEEEERYRNAVRGAMSVYVDLCERGFWGKLFRRAAVVKRPWLLVSGLRNAGKSSFLANSGAAFEFISPESSVGLPRFYFADNAVYVDVPDIAAASHDESGALRGLLPRYMFLRRRAFDGALFVVDVRELSAMDAAALNKTAADLRVRADALALATGYEIPIYFIFNKVDHIDGFDAFFHSWNGVDSGALQRIRQGTRQTPLLGAVFSGRYAESSPADAFSNRHKEICDELSDACVRMVVGAENMGHYDRNGRLYRFLTRFTLSNAPIAAFLAEFFRPRSCESVRFRGFFFTSSRSGAAPTAALSKKIVDEDIPNARARVKEIAEGTLQYYLKKAGLYAITVFIWAAAVYLFVGGGLRDALHIRTLQSELTGILEGEATPVNRFAALEKMRRSHEYLQNTFRCPWRLIFRTDGALAAVRRAYIATSERAIVEPTARSVETSIKRLSATKRGPLPGREQQMLYRELETYLVLTGGNRVKGVSVDSIAYYAISAFGKPPGVDDGVFMSNIRAVAQLAADGEYKNVSANQETVAAARERLAAAPQAAAVYASTMERLSATQRPFPLQQIIGGGAQLRYGRDICGLYTRAGWENTVFPELIKVSKAPIKADWVTGTTAVTVNEEKLLKELTALYADDICRRWLDLIRNVYVNIQPSLPSIARDLEAAAGHDSEVKRMLAAVCSLATQQPLDISLAKPSASSVKGQVTNAVNKLRGGAAVLNYDIADPFAEARGTFAHIEAFLKNGAFDGYQSALGGLAEKIRQCGDRNSYAAFIARGAADPLRECRQTLDRAYASMPTAVSAPLKRVLEPPLDIASATLTKTVAEEIEESWNAEVVNTYVGKLVGRYPLDKKGNDLAWSDFEEFFRPQSGILWKYCDKNLSGILERTSRGWEGVGRASALPLSLNDDMLRCLGGAERIAYDFFKKDGQAKRHEIIFYPIKSSSGEVVIIVGDKQFDFKGGLPITVGRRHGSETDETITLRLTTSDKAQEEMRFAGEWAAVRLFEAGKVERMGNDRYRINWRMNVRGIYTANITAVAQSNTTALFDRSVTEGFTVPKRVFKNN